LRRHPAVPYVIPFLLFLAFLGLGQYLPVPEFALQAIWVGVIAAVLWIVARPAIDLGVSHPIGTLFIGVGTFLIWVLPDALFPHYRSSWAFQNAITGTVKSGLSIAAQSDWATVALRALRAVAIVPVLEELFWRGWLMRWLIGPEFEKVPIGRYQARAFWITAILFAAEHGPFWDVGLAAGIAFNWWLVRSRRLGDVIWAHAITNACLCAYVIATHKWEYWM